MSFSILIDSLLGIKYKEERTKRNSPIKTISLNSFQKKYLESHMGDGFIFLDSCERYKKSNISPDFYFVLGDNRNSSTDSRLFGSVPANLIVGKASYILFSFSRGKLRSQRFF